MAKKQNCRFQSRIQFVVGEFIRRYLIERAINCTTTSKKSRTRVRTVANFVGNACPGVFAVAQFIARSCEIDFIFRVFGVFRGE